MSTFPRIAIVGRGCVLPGALDPNALWEILVAGETTGRFVEGFDEVFDAGAFHLPEADIAGLDPLFHWGMHTARQALRSAGYGDDEVHERAGVILGNKLYPTPSMIELAEEIWRRKQGLPTGRPVDRRNRFAAGLPASIIADAVGFGGISFCLDTACASSLYAIELASRRLKRGDADLMIAGGINGADDEFIGAGFRAVQASSPTGRSRPFHRDADGLVPSQGAAMVVLKRLDDALAAGDSILAVIRAIGLSNDGRSRGFLPPCERGQLRSMRSAYEQSGLSPSQISFVECHAAGTPRGDATEVRSLSRLFEGCDVEVPIGSLKSNLGHLITVSGAAGLLKILGAFEHGIRPPTVNANPWIDELDDAPLRLLHDREPWESTGIRRAAINNFGFGGNNAHLIVEEFDESSTSGELFSDTEAVESGEPLAVIAINRVDDVDLDESKLRFPPVDLHRALPQQRLVVSAALPLSEVIEKLDSRRTGAFVGMTVSTATTDHCLRWRGFGVDVPAFDATRAMGCMPNMVTNRLNAQFDLRAQSLTIAAEELSGPIALDTAIRALRRRDIDAALVGAVDDCTHPVHLDAVNALLGPKTSQPARAAVALVVKRLEDARRDGDDILAKIHGVYPIEKGGAPFSAPLGHAASGLFAIAEKIDGPASPIRRETIEINSLSGDAMAIIVERPRKGLSITTTLPTMEVYSGADLTALGQNLQRRQLGDDGPLRLVLTGTPDELPSRRRRALSALCDAHLAGFGQLEPGIYLGDGTLSTEIAFVFTGPAGAYRGMGRHLLEALPELVDRFSRRCSRIDELAGWIYGGGGPIEPAQKMWGATFLSQIHAEFTRHILDVEPDGVIGFCSGEMNALFAMGVWEDLDEFYDTIFREEVFDRRLAGRFEAVRQAWHLDDDVDPWQSWRIFAPADRVRRALADNPHCHLTIINAPGDLTIGGTAPACAELIDRLQPERAQRLGYDVAMHCDVLQPIEDRWHRLHDRPTNAVSNVRFYTHATGGQYSPSQTAVAEALVGQATKTVDFPSLIDGAWEDGLRIFVEHGPRAGCTRWISKILGDRKHLAVSLDAVGRNSFEQALQTAARLVAAGVDVNWRRLVEAANSHPRLLPRPPSLPPVRSYPPAARDNPADVQALLSATHRQYLQTRSDLHRQFLAHRHSVSKWLSQQSD